MRRHTFMRASYDQPSISRKPVGTQFTDRPQTPEQFASDAIKLYGYAKALETARRMKYMKWWLQVYRIIKRTQVH